MLNFFKLSCICQRSILSIEFNREKYPLKKGSYRDFNNFRIFSSLLRNDLYILPSELFVRSALIGNFQGIRIQDPCYMAGVILLVTTR